MTKSNSENISMPKGRIDTWPIKSVRESEDNAKKHSAVQIERLAAGLEEFGFLNPLKVDESGELLAGHGRLAAAQYLNLTEVPVIVFKDLDATQKTALRLADNQIGEMGEWDIGLLTEELGTINPDSVSLLSIGFTDEEIATMEAAEAKLAAENNTTDPSKPTEPPPATTLTGDTWLLGRHRITCGDPAEPDVFARALDGAKPKITISDLARSEYAAPEQVWPLIPTDVAYIWHPHAQSGKTLAKFRALDFEPRAHLILDLEQIVGRSPRYKLEHEAAYYLVRKGKNSHWVGNRKQKTVITPDGEGVKTLPTIAFITPLINHTRRGDAFLDPFLGHATGLIAAEMTGRTCLAAEFDGARVDAAIERWQRRTKKQATLEGTTKTFDAIKGKRK